MGTFWDSIDNTLAIRALVITMTASLIVAAIGAVMGTLVAWVLVRDTFPGKRFVNALIDLPFALPTIVAGLTLIALYGPGSPVGIHLAYTRGAVIVALLFVTLPFVVRSVQPVLIELDQEVEEAAASLGASNATTFRRIVLPALRPAIFSGAALAFARSIGEFGSLALIAGKVQIASIVIYADIESGSEQSAAALSVVLMLVALVVLFILRLDRSPRWSLAAAPRCRCASVALLYLTLLLLLPVAVVFWRTFEHGVGTAWSFMTTPGGGQRALADDPAGRDRGAAQRDLRCRRGDGARPREGAPGRQGHPRRADRPAIRRLAGDHRAGADPRLRPGRLVRRCLPEQRDPDHLRGARDG